MQSHRLLGGRQIWIKEYDKAAGWLWQQHRPVGVFPSAKPPSNQWPSKRCESAQDIETCCLFDFPPRADLTD
jgi:hypothetical protein